MDSGSILMIYQHFPRVKHGEYVRRTCMQTGKRTGSCPAIITDNEIVFFMLAKNQKLAARLNNILECYAATYKALQCVQCR